MPDILYWPGDRLDSADSSRSDSPFWTAVEQVMMDSKTLRVACPYLAPAYVEELVDSVEEWRLVTDVQAWTRVYGGEKEAAIKSFVANHEERIRHYPGLHAKAVVGDESAVFGSANLTRNGMVERQEMSVRMTASERVSELQEWFDDVWTAGKQIEKGVLPTERTTVDPHRREQDGDALDVFERLERAPNREWVESLLDVMREAVQIANLGEGDPRLVTSAAQDDRLVVTVNSRYVCAGYLDGPPEVGFILANESDAVDEVVRNVHPSDYYRFSTRDGRDPHWVRFDRHPEEALPPEVRPAWEAAIEKEVERGTRSQYREHHDGRVYRLIVDDDYRDQVMAEVFY